MNIIKDLLEELATIEILESELEFQKEMKDKDLYRFMPKDVGSVSYDEERVSGGIIKSEEDSIMEFAKNIDNIDKLEQIVKIMRKKIDGKFDAITNILSDKERRVFKSHFIDGKTYKDISIDIDRTERQVCRIVKDIKAKIKELDILSNMPLSI